MAECCEAIGEAGINILAGAGIASSNAAIVIVTNDADGTAAVLGDLGVDRVVFSIWPQEPDAALSELDRFTSIADSFLSRT